MQRYPRNKPSVLVVMPVYNAEDTIEESISSVIGQSHPDIRIAAVDDSSDDDSYEIMVRLSEKYANLSVFHTPYNVGTYKAINYALFRSRFLDFDFFLVHGADDLMLPNKVKDQISLLVGESKLYCVVGYERILRDKSVVSGRDYGDSMVMYSREVLDGLGYYDGNRFGCDSEFLERCMFRYGIESGCWLPKRLSLCYLQDKNLTVRHPLGGEERSSYVKEYRIRHKKMKAEGSYFLDSCWTEKHHINSMGKQVVGAMATVPSRMESLKDTVGSVLGQLDRLIVYQNGYRQKLDFLKSPKVKIISSLDTGQDMGDAGKFYEVGSQKNCIYFSLDDDLLYPNDYVERTLGYLRKHDYKVIATSHGRTMKPDAVSYYSDVLEYFAWMDEVQKERFVHFGGTGVMAMDPEALDISFDQFGTANMADIWVGRIARRLGVPILVFPHEKGWIRSTNKTNPHETIWVTNMYNRVQNELIKDFDKSAVNK